MAEYNVAQREKFLRLQPEDLVHIAAIRDLVQHHADEHVAAFFDYLAALPEAAELFRRRDLLEAAKLRKRQHLLAMVAGDYGSEYVEQRVALGVLYSQAALDTRIFLGAFGMQMQSIGASVIEHFANEPAVGFAHFMSLHKIAYFDIGIIIDVLIAERERTIVLQQATIRELSTPTLRVRDHLSIVPIIGLLDADRAKQLTDGLLQAIRTNRSKVVVMDVTGVAIIDSNVANHLVKTVDAARMMGAAVLLTGLSTEVAQSLVTLGVDLDQIATFGDLQDGLREAEHLLGV